MQDNDFITLDCRYMLCPLPMLKLQQKWRLISKKQIICCLTTDPQAPDDIIKFIIQQQALLISHQKKHDIDYITIQK